MKRTFFPFAAAALALSLLSGCTAAPRVRPVKMGDVDTGADSVEAVRRQLKGTWELVSLELFSASGQKTAAKATGRLTYDDFGNLAIKGAIQEGASLDPAALNLTGRVTIDPVAHTFTVGGVSAATPDDRRIDPKLDTSHVRHYTFEGDLLKTSLKNPSGATTATITWKKIG
jgi:outer membrane murein-binding lipoprotein Lpp